MKKLAFILLPACLFSLLLICIAWHQPIVEPDAIIRIDGSKKGPALSPDMYGIFFEDINHAADGGLYAELIQNRDFEYNRVPEEMKWLNDASIVTENGWRERYRKPDELFAWSLTKNDGAVASIHQTDANPLNSENPMSLELNIESLGKGIVKVSNEGFWGIGIKNQAIYLLSLYARKDVANSGRISVALESKSGKVYASKVISGIGGNWKQFNVSLNCNAADADARFVIKPLSKGKLWFDMVSLFPKDTYKQRNNGMRKDLAEMLAALHPSFMRFPGGCVVEGATLDNRIQWKKTIGPVAERPGNWNVWRYHTTEGLGYHEFLQLCEDLNVNPMYVVNVGMSCQARAGYCAPPADIKNYVQEALDALEYAMGPADSKWGAVRARNGHTAPFKIKYVEIGNENHGPFYQDVYKIFQTAIKQQYPDVVTIADEPIDLNNDDKQKYPGVNVEMVDEHYYQSPNFFYTNYDRYDQYKRESSPKIYIGEFAVTTPDGGAGNMSAALGESAFMIGMERNADIVRMASYAPTFVNTNDRRWMPDMIVFNNSTAYGTPSYYALKTFSNNRPDYILPTRVTTDHPSVKKDDGNLKGGFGFTSKNTKMAFKDIKVIMDGKDVFNDDLQHGIKNWTIKSDNWQVKDGVLTNNYDEMKANIMLLHNDWKNYNLSFKVQKVSGEEGIHIAFLNGGGGSCTLNMNKDGFNLMQARSGTTTSLGKIPQKLVEGKWYAISVDIKGTSIKCFIDDKLMFDNQLKENVAHDEVFVTAGIQQNSKQLIVKIVNPDQRVKTCRLQFNNLQLAPAGEVITIKSIDQSDENSFSKPFNIKPATKKLAGIANQFDYQCPANSISVLRLSVK